ncbi:MAG: hypothetical protein CM15mP74_10080 [Halieaceae bacterium]|nr:MAG: hypothetical protein CM15mP74_10080 [Halieaceae bacterium]
MVMVVVVVFACVMYVIEGAGSGFESIPMSIYWAVVTITTVGYGDLVPQTPAGRFVAGFGMLVGYSIIAVPTAIITANSGSASTKGRARTRPYPGTVRCAPSRATALTRFTASIAVANWTYPRHQGAAQKHEPQAHPFIQLPQVLGRVSWPGTVVADVTERDGATGMGQLRHHYRLGDGYVDHPSFGMAVIGRVLEAQGFRVGMIAQPDWQSAKAFEALGRPNLFSALPPATWIR